MNSTMTREELQHYMTVAQKTMIFVNDYQPEGWFMETKKERDVMYNGSDVLRDTITFETRIYKRTGDVDIFMGNAHASENMLTNSKNDIDAFRFCETSSRGRALSVIGIGLDVSISSMDDISCNVDYSGPKAVKSVSNPQGKPKGKQIKRPSIVQNLKRMKIGFEELEDRIVITDESTSGKSLTVLRRYGFDTVDGKMVLMKGSENV